MTKPKTRISASTKADGCQLSCRTLTSFISEKIMIRQNIPMTLNKAYLIMIITSYEHSKRTNLPEIHNHKLKEKKKK